MHLNLSIPLDSDHTPLETAIDIHTLLKQGTRALHTELDHHPLVKPLLSTDSTPQEIAFSLMGFLRAYAALEQSDVTSQWRKLNLGYTEQCFSNLLQFDISALSGLEHNIPKVTLSTEMSMQYETELLGSLYVVLGSAMGATRISSILAQNPYLSIRDVSFFKHLAQSATCFRTLMIELKQRTLSPQQADDILNSAKKTFRLFIHSFDCVLVEIGAIDSHGQH
jgi:heme oxygenase